MKERLHDMSTITMTRWMSVMKWGCTKFNIIKSYPSEIKSCEQNLIGCINNKHKGYISVVEKSYINAIRIAEWNICE